MINIKETPRRKVTAVTSSLNEKTTDQLGNKVGVEEGQEGRCYSSRPPIPLSTSRLLDRYVKTT
jgi:hypothetical protein